MQRGLSQHRARQIPGLIVMSISDKIEGRTWTPIAR
ncbi:MAG: hypothetical protein H6645_11270 [Caldilineaceae bacterium]|nr:hypothetical protein [Caldilineaceae bacterium]